MCRGSSIRNVRCLCCHGEVRAYRNERYNLTDGEYHLLVNSESPDTVLLLHRQYWNERIEKARRIEQEARKRLEAGMLPGVGASLK